MATDVVEIDPSGDVVLVCGQGEDVQKLRVSSKVLSLGSPVFWTMLGPNFKEGKQLSTEGTLDLSLPDDDGGVMAHICYVMHMRYKEVSSHLDIDNLRALATLADKYDCAAALGPSIDHWIGTLSVRCSDDTRAILILLAFLLRRPGWFKHLGKEHVLECRLPHASTITIGAEGYDIVQETIRQLAAHGLGYRLRLESFISSKIALYCSPIPRGNDDCDQRYQYAVDFVRKLGELELWPIRPGEHKSLDVMLKTMSASAMVKKTLSHQSCIGTMYRCQCHRALFHASQTIADELAEGAAKIMTEMKELCLECTIEGEVWKKTDCKHVHAWALPLAATTLGLEK